MMRFILPIAMAGATLAAEPVKSGKAKVQLIAASSTYQAGEPIKAAIDFHVDRGWHTYWTNPGEGGMPLRVKWTLPEGWKAGELEWPMPIRFKTGDLPGFGYEGRFLVQVSLTPPSNATGAVDISAKLDWLTCNDGACVPGNAQVSLALQQGENAPTVHSELIESRAAELPVPLEGAALEAARNGAHVVLVLKLPEGFEEAPSEVFPATRNVVDPGAVFKFEREGDHWKATIGASEYLEGEPEALELVMRIKGMDRPAKVTWHPPEKKNDHLKE
jgi:DsbC/DsbD-like thiol-disulfide interchange protein